MERGISWEDRIKGAYASLRPSEQKVASFFLAHAGELESLTIGELASAAGVSEPTVIRCVRGLGYRGYRAFKGALRGWEAGEESAFDHLGGFSLRPWDRMENLPLKAVGTQREALEDVLKSVSPDSLAQAAQTLASARLIVQCGEFLCPGQRSADQTDLFGAPVPLLHRRVSSADQRGPSEEGGCGGGLFPLGPVCGHREGAAAG